MAGATSAASAGKRIAVFSDYPAVDKLKAMGLQADLVVCATDPAIALLKPDPAGLLLLRRWPKIGGVAKAFVANFLMNTFIVFRAED